MPHIFISYAKVDTHSLTLELLDWLSKQPNITVWMDKSLRPATSWATQIQNEIDRSDCLIVLLSPDVNRVETRKQLRSFVLHEIDYARQTNKLIVPIMAQQTLVPVQLAGIEYIDFTSNDQQLSYIRLLETISNLSESTSSFDLRQSIVDAPVRLKNPLKRNSAIVITSFIIGILFLLVVGLLISVRNNDPIGLAAANILTGTFIVEAANTVAADWRTMTERARFLQETATVEAYTDTPTSTNTPNLIETIQFATNQRATIEMQATLAIPTNTSEPTSTVTLTPTAVDTPSPTSTYDLTLTSQFEGVATATQAAITTQLFETAVSEQLSLLPFDDGKSRFTMLVAGLDRPPNQEGREWHTEFMMLVSFDPITDRISFLNLPPYLYVEVPGYSSLQPLNTVFTLGEQQRSGYGSQLLMQTLQYNLGIRVHNYLILDSEALIKLVEAVGGIEIDLPYPINDRTYTNWDGKNEPLELPAGYQVLNGSTAMKFVSAWGYPEGMNERLRLQLLFLNSIADIFKNSSKITALVEQANSIWSGMQPNIYSGLVFEEVLQLVLFAKHIPAESWIFGILDEEYQTSLLLSGQGNVQIPNRTKLGELMINTFGSNYSQ